VKQIGYNLNYAYKEQKNDKNLLYELVKQNGISLKYASKELKNDHDIVFEAVKENGRSLEYASNKLKNDHEIVIEAIKNSPFCLMYASERIKNDFRVVSYAIEKNKFKQGPQNILDYVSIELQNNNELILKTLLKKPYGKYLDWGFSKNIYLNCKEYSMKVRYFKCFTNFLGFDFFDFHGFDFNFRFNLFK
jgi:hypothetical protein